MTPPTRILRLDSTSLFALLIAVGLFVVSACDTGLGNEDGITYIEGGEPTPVYEEPDPGAAAATADGEPRASWRDQEVELDYALTRVAQTLPVEVDGISVQANDVVLIEDADGAGARSAIVAYNTAGGSFAGAIQIIDLSTAERPVITAELAFPNVDITTIALLDDTLLFGGAIEPGVYETERAFVASIDLGALGGIRPRNVNEFVTETINGAVELSTAEATYYFTTGIAITADEGSEQIVVSAGADPGAIVLFDANLTEIDRVESSDDARLYDIRDIEAHYVGAIAVAGTTVTEGTTDAPENARILVMRLGDQIRMHDRSTLEIADFGSEDAKATIEVYRLRYGFAALSEAGFQAFYLRNYGNGDETTLEPLYTIENPSVLWSDRTDTNSATYAGRLVFTANGEAGFRVFRTFTRLSQRLTGWTDAEDPFTHLGFVPFDQTEDANGDFWSANHIEFFQNESNGDGVLVVASGLGGVNFYTVTATE